VSTDSGAKPTRDEPIGRLASAPIGDSTRPIEDTEVAGETGEIAGTGPVDEPDDMTENESGHMPDLLAGSEPMHDADGVDGTDVLEGSGPVDDVDPGTEAGEIAGVNPFDETGRVDGDDPVEGDAPPVGFGASGPVDRPGRLDGSGPVEAGLVDESDPADEVDEVDATDPVVTTGQIDVADLRDPFADGAHSWRRRCRCRSCWD